MLLAAVVLIAVRHLRHEQITLTGTAFPAVFIGFALSAAWYLQERRLPEASHGTCAVSLSALAATLFGLAIGVCTEPADTEARYSRHSRAEFRGGSLMRSSTISSRSFRRIASGLRSPATCPRAHERLCMKPASSAARVSPIRQQNRAFRRRIRSRRSRSDDPPDGG